MAQVPNKSLQAKSAARTLAVQALYLASYEDKLPEADALVGRMLSMLEDEKTEEMDEFVLPEKPHKPTFLGIVSGALAQMSRLDETLQETLTSHWEGERMTELQRAILRAATYELIFHPQTNTKILLNEYVNLSASFYDNPELGLINGLLQEVVGKVRPA